MSEEKKEQPSKPRRARRKPRLGRPSILNGYPRDFQAFVEDRGDFGIPRDTLFRLWACIREGVTASAAVDWDAYLQAVDSNLQQVITVLSQQQQAILTLSAAVEQSLTRTAATEPVQRTAATPGAPQTPRPLLPPKAVPIAPQTELLVPTVEPGVITAEDRDRYLREAAASIPGVSQDILFRAVDEYIQYCFTKPSHPGEATSRPLEWIAALVEKYERARRSGKLPIPPMPEGGAETWANPEEDDTFQ